ncbi:U6 snRNA-associated Sm-like protein LSm7 [Echinops telfairi]|uniref:U6 snRNA-associated Sm-like protein LSm7 n=1 Tax=Echinops telfairi TaxID=9371 RepID=A0AC55DW68_ECHTE|nr:U6 snRNA-associated Sm-like protein LSm7 [Echinops telfairi]
MEELAPKPAEHPSFTLKDRGLGKLGGDLDARAAPPSPLGILKGFDPLLNLVLDGTIEYMRDPDDQYKLTEDTRQLGLVVCRGTSVVLICPQDGMEAIPNPFIQQPDA